jgi:hypothetical protein
MIHGSGVIAAHRVYRIKVKFSSSFLYAFPCFCILKNKLLGVFHGFNNFMVNGDDIIWARVLGHQVTAKWNECIGSPSDCKVKWVCWVTKWLQSRVSVLGHQVTAKWNECVGSPSDCKVKWVCWFTKWLQSGVTVLGHQVTEKWNECVGSPSDCKVKWVCWVTKWLQSGVSVLGHQVTAK